jgi:hypothetical protein
MLVIGCMALSACTQESRLIDRIDQQLEKSARRNVDLAVAAPQPWKRVCIIGPYSGTATIDATLGFAWKGDGAASGFVDEGVTLLLFVSDDDKVVALANYPRRKGDFSPLAGQCFPREKARFRQIDKPAKDWPGLYPADAGR